MSDPLAQYKADYISELEDSVREDMAAGVPLEDIVASIEEAGLPRDDAALIVAKVESAARTRRNTQPLCPQARTISA